MARKADYKDLNAEQIKTELMRWKAPSKIAADHGVSLVLLEKFCLLNDIDIAKFKRKYVRITDEMRKRIEREARTGKSIIEISKLLNVGTSPIQRVLSETGSGEEGRWKKRQKRIDELKGYIEQGYTVAEICDATDTCEGTVRYWLYKAHLKPIPKAEYEQRGIKKGRKEREEGRMKLLKPDSMAKEHWPMCKTCKYRGTFGQYPCCDFLLIERRRKDCIPALGIYDSYVQDEKPRRFNTVL